MLLFWFIDKSVWHVSIDYLLLLSYMGTVLDLKPAAVDSSKAKDGKLEMVQYHQGNVCECCEYVCVCVYVGWWIEAYASLDVSSNWRSVYNNIVVYFGHRLHCGSFHIHTWSRHARTSEQVIRFFTFERTLFSFPHLQVIVICNKFQLFIFTLTLKKQKRITENIHFFCSPSPPHFCFQFEITINLLIAALITPPRFIFIITLCVCVCCCCCFLSLFFCFYINIKIYLF